MFVSLYVNTHRQRLGVDLIKIKSEITSVLFCFVNYPGCTQSAEEKKKTLVISLELRWRNKDNVANE